MSRATFYPSWSVPVPVQYQAIGRVAVHWSVVEFQLEGILVRLAMAPDFIGMALTNDLGPDNRVSALRNLIEIHRIRYSAKVVPMALLDELAEIHTEIQKLKAIRNRIIHYVWFRSTDERMHGQKFRGKVPLDTPERLARRRKDRERDDGEYDGGNHLGMTVTSINKVADQIVALGDRMVNAARQLPGIDEGWLARSLIRGEHLRHSETPKGRPARPSKPRG